MRINRAAVARQRGLTAMRVALPALAAEEAALAEAEALVPDDPMVTPVAIDRSAADVAAVAVVDVLAPVGRSAAFVPTILKKSTTKTSLVFAATFLSAGRSSRVASLAPVPATSGH